MSSLSILNKISLVKEIYLHLHSLYTVLNLLFCFLQSDLFFWSAHLFRPLTFYFKVRFCYLLLFNHFRSFKSSRKKEDCPKSARDVDKTSWVPQSSHLEVSTYEKNPLGTSLSTCLSLIGLNQVLSVFYLESEKKKKN